MKAVDEGAKADAERLESAQSAPVLIGLIRRQLDKGISTLRFFPELEREYCRHTDLVARYNRIALMGLAVLVLALSPLLDTAFFGLSGAASAASQKILVGLLIPVLLVSMMWLILLPHSRYSEAVTLVQFLLVSFGLLANHVIVARFGADFPVEFVGVSMIAVVAMARIRTWLIIPSGIALALSTLLAELFLVDSSPRDFYHLAAAGVLGLFAGYLQCANDYVMRRAWLDRQLLQLVARRDGLTGLLNRHALENALSGAHAHAVRAGAGYGLAMIDIDQFGAFNNNYGHPAGDEALRQVAETLEAHARRPLDICGRYGGEEFVVFWHMEDRDDAIEEHAESLRRAVEDLGITHEYSPVAPIVTVSIGLCHVRDARAGESLSAVFDAADSLLYQAKSAGRNQVATGVFENAPDSPNR